MARAIETLIWTSVLEDARVYADAEVVLVTANTSDFAQDERLHPDLQRDVASLGRSASVAFAPSLQAAVDRYVSKRLPPSDETQQASLQHALQSRGRLHRWLLDKIPGSIERIRLGVNGPIEEARRVRIFWNGEKLIDSAKLIGWTCPDGLPAGSGLGAAASRSLRD
jgi:hypothetical protein